MSEQFRAVIADDEEPLRLHLRRTLEELWPELEICGEAGNGRQAADLIEEHGPDIAFLDIKMPGLSGIEVAARVPEHCQVVFITAYDEYAVRAFEQEALDYLLKPVTSERLAMTVARLKKKCHAGLPGPGELSRSLERVLRAMEKEEGPLQWIRVQAGREIELVAVGDVFYFQASDKYTVVMTGSGEHLIRKSISRLAEELDSARFWQIHRKTIVNVEQIARIGKSVTGRFVVHLRDVPDKLTVSRSFSHLFKQM